MTDKLMNALAVVASRVAKLVVSSLALWLLVRWKIDSEPLREAMEAVVESMFIAGALGLGAHFGVALKTNPKDTASPTEAKRGRQEKKARAQARKHKKIDDLVNTDPLAEDEIPPLAKIPASEKGE